MGRDAAAELRGAPGGFALACAVARVASAQPGGGELEAQLARLDGVPTLRELASIAEDRSRLAGEGSAGGPPASVELRAGGPRSHEIASKPAPTFGADGAEYARCLREAAEHERERAEAAEALAG